MSFLLDKLIRAPIRIKRNNIDYQNINPKGLCRAGEVAEAVALSMVAQIVTSKAI